MTEIYTEIRYMNGISWFVILEMQHTIAVYKLDIYSLYVSSKFKYAIWLILEHSILPWYLFALGISSRGKTLPMYPRLRRLEHRKT